MLIRRYAPFAVLVTAMLVLVIVAPSRASSSTASPFATYVAPSGGPSAAAGGPGVTPGAGASPSATAGQGASTPGAGPASNATRGPAAPGSSAGQIGAAATQAGDTSHCVNGRQFGQLVTAPPCTPKFAGDNGGATWQGVTKDTIEFVYYREKDNPAVKAIEQQAGVYSDPNDQKAFLLGPAQDFINKHFELYGRKLHIDFYQGNCSPAPPVPSCDRTDADTIVNTYHPFMVLYDNNANLPEFFDQLSQDHTMSFGGWHFADTFNQQERPWHWDLYMGGLYQAELTGEWWCRRMANHPARYAGDASLQTQMRKTAIVTPTYPVNKESADHLAAIINGCAPGSAEVIPYSSDTTTAAAQSNSDVAKEQKDGITSLLWFSDPIAPVYGTAAQASQNYHPEEVLVGSGLLDYDALAQLYDASEWKNAFGLSDIQNQPLFTKTDAAIVWHSEGRSGDPYSAANLPWGYLAAFAYIVNQIGPNLNPGTFEQAAFHGPYLNFWATNHDPGHPYVAYGTDPSAYGAYAGIHDAREVYWDPNATSPINGKKGAYVAINGGARYAHGAFPSSQFSRGGAG